MVISTRRVGKLLFLISVSLLATLGLWGVPAEAQEGDPPATATLDRATIEVIPGSDRVEVLERIEVSGLDALERKEIEHIVSRPGESGIEDLRIAAGDRELAFDRTEGNLLDRVLVSAPEGAGDELVYEISYRYPEVGDENKVPLVVPAISSSDVANNVSLQVGIPEGEYLHSSFPLLKSGEPEMAGAGMVGFPSYASFVVKSSPVGIFTSANMYTALTFVVIIGCVGGLLLFDRRSKAKTRTGEVSGV